MANLRIVMMLIMTPCSLVDSYQCFGKYNASIFTEYTYPQKSITKWKVTV